MESKIKNPRIPIPVIVQNLEMNFTCPTCNHILCNAVTSGCCGLKMCSHCYEISLRNQTCPFCRRTCRSAVRCTNIDAEIFAAFMKVGPDIQDSREIFLQKRELEEFRYNEEQIEQEELRLTLAEEEDAKRQTAKASEPEPKAKKSGIERRRRNDMPPPPPGSPPRRHTSRIQSAPSVFPLPMESVDEGQANLSSTEPDLTPKDFAQNEVEMKNATSEQNEILDYINAMNLKEEGNIPLASNLKSKHIVQSAKENQESLSEDDDELLEYLIDVEHYLKTHPFESMTSGSVTDQTVAISKAPPMALQLNLEESDEEVELEFPTRDEIEEQERLQYLEEVKDCMLDDKMKYFVPDSASKFRIAAKKTPPKSVTSMRKEFEEFQATIDKITKEPEVENDGQMDATAKLSLMLDEMAKSHERTQKAFSVKPPKPPSEALKQFLADLDNE